MKVVDIADEIYRELGSPSSISIPSVAFWLRTNIGMLNSRINKSYVINSTTLEIEETVDSVTTEIGEDEKAILKKMYSLHYYDIKIRENLGAAGTESAIEVAANGMMVRKISKTEIGKHLQSVRKMESEELDRLVKDYKINKGVPRQVTGDDIKSPTDPLAT